jgi:hypothetical protein
MHAFAVFISVRVMKREALSSPEHASLQARHATIHQTCMMAFQRMHQRKFSKNFS